MVLAVASCALHPGGLFNAYRAIADLPRVDAVVHLGDYLYEYGPEGYGAATGKRLGRVPESPREMTTLADYWLRHAQYKRDPDLQAAHARAAMPDVPIGAMIAAMNEEVLFCDQRAKGYVLLTLTREHARAEFRAVSTVIAKPFTVATIAMYEVRAGDATVALRRV
ncbi:MAG: alkaline phosphatase [Sphingomonas bacterium]|uniref:alkaline phosphatase D family protein n=1 Tax=Sphingomonas bacterium TaxID=1895847 RepID=UPI002630F065|nr:alkaline phosphatase D family protein [Sphingomonas bacterium]MDB5694535.1 alkaline phosphatase [Sphingomonas bacterium]